MGDAAPFISAGAGVLGAGISAIGAIGAGNASSQAAQANAAASYYQSQVAQNNKQIALQNAENAAQVGVEQTARKSMENAAKMGLVRTGIAASGVAANTGSAKNVQVGQRELGQLDAETVLSNAQQKVYGYKVQAANFQDQANLDIAGGQRQSNEAAYDSTAGYLKGASTLLSSASLLPAGLFTGGGGGTDTPPAQQTGGI